MFRLTQCFRGRLTHFYFWVIQQYICNFIKCGWIAEIFQRTCAMRTSSSLSLSKDTKREEHAHHRYFPRPKRLANGRCNIPLSTLKQGGYGGLSLLMETLICARGWDAHSQNLYQMGRSGEFGRGFAEAQERAQSGSEAHRSMPGQHLRPI